MNISKKKYKDLSITFLSNLRIKMLVFSLVIMNLANAQDLAAPKVDSILFAGSNTVSHLKINDLDDIIWLENYSKVIISDSLGVQKYQRDFQIPIKQLVSSNFLIYGVLDQSDHWYILDNRLNIIQDLSFSKKGWQVAAICFSGRNEVWLFDEFNKELIRYDFQLNQIITRVTSINFTPNKIWNVGNRIYLLTENTLLVYDFRGVFLREYRFDNLKQMVLADDQKFYFIENNQLKSINPEDGKISNPLITLEKSDFFIIKDEKILVLMGRALYIYTLEMEK